MKRVVALSLSLLLMTSIVIFVVQYDSSSATEEEPFYVGVTFCGNTTSEARLLIDRVKAYTNLFVLQSGPISKNETAINEICDYAVASGFDIIVYFGWFDPIYPWRISWLDFAKQRWSDRFLGVYFYDEPGGIQLDHDWARWFNRVIPMLNSSLYQSLVTAMQEYINGTLPRNYDVAAQGYIDALRLDTGIKELKNRSITAFVSDYALYWFDYLGGFDVILAQFGWNNSVAQEIALVRGAARMQNKNWGAIITWKYMEPPYLGSGDEIYDQMCMAYEAGADYIMFFNYPEVNNPYGTMRDEHFDALEKFWNEMVKNPSAIHGSVEAEAVLVLPKNYGWGMRRPDDKIWYWEPDEKSPQIWGLSRQLLLQYGHRLDIIYEDPQFPVTDQYKEVYNWDDSLSNSSP